MQFWIVAVIRNRLLKDLMINEEILNYELKTSNADEYPLWHEDE